MAADQMRRRRAASNPFDDDTVDDEPPVNGGSGPGGRRGGNRRAEPARNNDPSASVDRPEHDPMLDHHERRLHSDVDADFFHDPSHFRALSRVISIIGAEIGSHGGNITAGSSIGTNFERLPQYQSMQHQQRVVEEAIEHMAVRHCADLNSSVAAVGRMSRQFDEAKSRVRNLRRQVRDVKDSLRLGELGDGGGSVRFSCWWGGDVACLLRAIDLQV